jgi:predicted DsbA family dithiol-disulfide isomerase/uncharacterized membrane protein
MVSRVSPLVLRLALLVAIGVSAALLIDYYRPLPAFCDVGSGCYKVRGSGYGSILHVPLPLLGLVGFTSVMAISLVHNNELAPRITRVLALVGAVVGALLLLLQGFKLQVFCKLCVAVDVAAMIAGVSSLFLHRAEDSAAPARARWLWPGATAVAMVLPGLWGVLQPSPPVPSEIASLWVPEKINVVEFVDFQCPFCRELHPIMLALVSEYAGRVHFVRLNVPLPSHADARSAARAYCCAEEQHKGDEMADALFRSRDISTAGCERLAASLGLSLSDYKACVSSTSTDARIDDEYRLAKQAGLGGLPTVWIGDRLFVGLQPMEAFRSAFVEAARGKTTRLPTALLWVVFAAALAAVGAIAVRVRATPTAPS